MDQATEEAIQILDWCIEDIKTTHWCQGVLSKVEEKKGKEKGMGCALGLLALNADFVEPRVIKGKRWWFAKNPTNHYMTLPKPLRKAIIAVANATTTATNRYSDSGPGSISMACHSIIGKNDNPTTDREEALNWFKKARASLAKGK